MVFGGCFLDKLGEVAIYSMVMPIVTSGVIALEGSNSCGKLFSLRCEVKFLKGCCT